MKKVMSNTKTKRKKSGGVFRKENKNNVIDADKKVWKI